MDALEIVEWRSFDDESTFFAAMGRFFASPMVRRECGGYPLNDGPFYRWFILRSRHDRRVLGFISVERQEKVLHLRQGYVRAEVRGIGLFRELLTQALAHADSAGLDCSTRVQCASAPFLEKYGFVIKTTRGEWITMYRSNKNA
ncbi:N-acetyltransferase [Corticibacter populi]|uniref:N-acetyltransferase n=1 Tax=Corticibacter populi TaxID=1550736 RepID=A0A3M6QXE3_9BURK|nr:GNAT family N-acetyltransferase [Corticibacter populi]RMX07581.1 N-acetyltransferase [Corticibacter populi]RZS30078.1 acetyltransferase (GNAT) family protein [Corticibacter populi]